jgi:hypothetical protein
MARLPTPELCTAKYGLDFAREYAQVLANLQAACKLDPQLYRLHRTLANDVFETLVFKETMTWLEACYQQGRVPRPDEAQHRMLLETGREITRRGLGGLLGRLAQAYARRRR